MARLVIDKIGSVTKNLNLSHEQAVSEDILTEHGAVLAVEVLEDKTIYNVLELPTGRMSKLKKGDVIAVALGERAGLKGFVGVMPKDLRVGDVINLLNMGGVAGECLSANKKEVGDPLRVQVMGAIVDVHGKPMNINQKKLFEEADKIESSIPLIVTTGTGMDAGKTTVSAQIIKALNRMGLTLSGAKLSGVGAIRDLYEMSDYGVKGTVSFIDCGISSTANIPSDRLVRVAKGAINYLSDKEKPDAIMIEFGDGLYGRYGVHGLISDPEIQSKVRLHIGCARDPVGAIKLAEECKALGLPLDIIAGPVTDNSVGQDFVRDQIGLFPFNVFEPNSDLYDLLAAKWTAQEKSAHRLSA